MAGFSRNIKIIHGMVQADVRLTTTKVTTNDDLVQVCTAHGQHDPRKPVWDPQCPECGTVKRSELDKAREVAKDTFAVFTQEEVDSLKEDDDQYKGTLRLSSHDAVEVEGQVMPEGTVYYLTPGKGDQMFPLLKVMIDENPDLTYLGIYTVTSRAALYRVRPFDGILVAEKLLWPAEIQATPEVSLTEVPEVMLDTVREVARKFVTPFDAANYRNTYSEKLATATAEREGQGMVPGPLADNVVKLAKDANPMASMLAQMAALVGTPDVSAPTEKPKRSRKTTTKAS